MNAHKPPENPRAFRRLDLASAGSYRRQSSDIRIVDSAALFAGHAEIVIDHDGALYRLKITRQGKLILNK